MNTEYLFEAELKDQNRIADLFDRLHCDAIEVRDAEGSQKGLVYLEDFCNAQELKIEPKVDDDATKHRDDEARLFKRLLQLPENEIVYARDTLLGKLGRSFVCSCDCRDIAKTIMEKIFGSMTVDVRYSESVFDLQDGDAVLFLSFNRIKLYRKMFRGKISSMMALNNVILDCENRAVFYSKYKDLLDTLNSIGVICLYGIIPEADQISGLSDLARRRVLGYGKADYEFCQELLGGCDSPDYIACMEQNRLSRVIDRGIFKSLLDCRSDFYNVTNGMRMTMSQPTSYKHTAYLFGPCTTRGAMVSDEHTVASFMQKQFNENIGGWLVLNCGVGGGSDLENSYRYVLSLPLKSGDAIVFLESGSFLEESTIDGKTIFKLSDDFNTTPPAGEWFLDRPAHCNAEANQVIADSFFRRISDRADVSGNKFDLAALARFRSGNKVFSDSCELSQYVSGVAKMRFDMKENESAGAILMHCNPMTRGHKYLIMEALKEVDYLYVFLLSIDRSEIPYALRREMLLHETRELSNVRVLDCGEFLGSPKVFPDYFTKDSKKHSRIDATKEVLVFCQYVAPALGVTKRFVGTENRDFVTRQYNNQLKLILPMYGLELREINRITEGGKDVSAFSTRQLIHEGLWDEAGKHVSPHTLELLKKHYMGEVADA